MVYLSAGHYVGSVVCVGFHGEEMISVDYRDMLIAFIFGKKATAVANILGEINRRFAPSNMPFVNPAH
jgi:hypothetical protein